MADELITSRSEEILSLHVLQSPAATPVLGDRDLKLATCLEFIIVTGDVSEGVDGQVFAEMGAKGDLGGVARGLQRPQLFLLQGGAWGETERE